MQKALRLAAIAGVVCATSGVAFAQSVKDTTGNEQAVVTKSTNKARTAIKDGVTGTSLSAVSTADRSKADALREHMALKNADRGVLPNLRGPAPANDECAAVVTPDGPAVGVGVPFDTTTATTSADADGGAAGPCDFFGDPTFSNDVWFLWDWFGSGFADLDPVTIATDTTGGTAVDTKIAVYDACGGTIIACNDDGGSNGPLDSEVSFTVDGVGVLFYAIRIGHPGAVGAPVPGTGVWTVSAGATGSGNDECVDATAISGSGPFFADTSTATTGIDPGDPLCLDFGTDLIDNDLWFAWDASGLGAGTLIEVTACANTTTDSRIAVYTDCPLVDPLSIVGCDDDGCGTVAGPSVVSIVHDGVTTEYIIRVGLFPGATAGLVQFEVNTVAVGSVCTIDNALLDMGQERDNLNAFLSDVTGAVSADNTRIGAGGDGEITNICWWGVYLGGQVLGDSFQVTYYADNGSFAPGASLGSFVEGTTLTVSSIFSGDIISIPGGGDFNVFEYTGSHAAVAVAADDCIWIEVVNTLEDGWFWSSAGTPTTNPGGNALGDGISLTTALAPYDGACDQNAEDLAWRIDEPIAAPAGFCSVAPVAANDLCASAQALNVSAGGSDGASGSTCGATVDECSTRDCIEGDAVLVDTAGVFYTVVGNGNTMTATTDNVGTDFDTTLAVYCGTCGDLVCITSNDDATAPTTPLTSSASWCAESGVTYYIRVSGFGGAVGSFDLTVTDDNTPCAGPASGTACSACSVALTGNIDENEPCGSALNDGCFADEITPPFGPTIGDGDVVNGNFWAEDGTRDTDWYPFTLTETADVVASVTADRFSLFGFINVDNDCNLDQLLFVGGGGTGADQTCEKSTITRRLAPGNYALVVLPGDFFNVCCENGGANYTAGLSILPVGSCCFEGGTFVGPNGNDDCGSATAIGEGAFRVDNTLATSLGDSGGATAGQPTTSCGGTLFNDIWWLYTASDDGEATISTCQNGATDFDTELAVYDATAGCPDGDTDGTDIACNDDFCNVAGTFGQSEVTVFVTAGQQLLIRVGSDFVDGDTGTGTLTVSLDTGVTPPAAAGSDDCATAALATAVNEGTYLVGDGAQTTDGFDEALCLFAGSAVVNNDWWVLYEATATGTAFASNCAGSVDTRIAIYNASCPIGIDEALACDDDTCGDAGAPPGNALSAYVEWPVVSGTQYLIRVGTFSAAVFPTNEPLEIGIVGPAVGAGVVGANGADDCASATVVGALPAVMAWDNAAATGGTPLENVNGDCGAFGTGEIFNDLWYSVTPGVNGTMIVQITTDGTADPTGDSRIAVYDTTCPILDNESLGCDDDGGDGLLSRLEVPVVDTNTYLIRVGEFGAATAGTTAEVNIEIFDPGSVGPNGAENCADTPVAIGEGTFAVDNSLSTTDGPADTLCDNAGSAQVFNDIWYSYTATCTGIATAETVAPGTLTDTRIAIYGDTCPTVDGEAIACDDDGGTGLLSLVTWNVVSGEKYFIRVGTFADTAFGTTTLEVSCEALAAPTNDDCGTAAAVSDGDTAFDSRLATTTGNPEPACEFAAGDDQIHNDLWYSYTATCTGFTTVAVTDADIDTRLAAYDACGGNLIACNDDNGGSLNASITFITVSGTKYWIRLGGFSAADAGQGTFNISCEEPAGCFELDSGSCATLGGNFVPGSTCFDVPNPCEAPAEGACELCTPGQAADCFVGSEEDCTNAGGTYLGNGTDCSGSPVLCPCDWNCDGFLNDQDFFDWANSFFSGPGPLDADFNDDGFENDQDWFDFVNCFFTPGNFPGCSA